MSTRFNVLKLKQSSDTPQPPPKDAGLYHRPFFSRSAVSLASPESISGPATPPSPFMPNVLTELGKRSNNGSLKSFNRGGRDYLPSPSADTDSSGSCPNHLGVYLSSNASSSSYTLSQETTSSVKAKKNVFKLANLTKRNKSKKDLSDVASSSRDVSRSTSASESEKVDGDEGISMPWNFQHHIHVDEGYIGLPPSWSNALYQVGFSEVEIATIHARRRAAANLLNPLTPDSPHPANASVPSLPSTVLEPAPRSTSLGKVRDPLTINPPSTYSTTASTVVGTNTAPSPGTPSFFVKSFVNGLKNSLSSDAASTKEVLGGSRSRDETGEEAEQYVFVDGNGPDEAGDRGMGDETLIEPYPFDSSSVSSHHAHASRVRQVSQDQDTPRTPAFPQIQVHRAYSEPRRSTSSSPVSCAPSPLAHSTSLPIPTPVRGYTYAINSSRPGPPSASPRTPPRRIYHVANASSDGEDYSEPPPAYASPKKEGFISKEEKDGLAPVGGPPPPNRPIPSVPVERTLGDPSTMNGHNNTENVQVATLSEHNTGSSVNIPGTADEVLDISSHYNDCSDHGEGAEVDPAQRISVLTPTPPLVIDKSLTKLATLPPRLSFHQEDNLEDWSASVFSVIGSKGKRSSILVKPRYGSEASTKAERRTTIRPFPPSAIVAPSLPDVSFGTNLTLGYIARPSIDAVEEEHSQVEKEEEQGEEIMGANADEPVVSKDTMTTTEQVGSSPVVLSTPPPAPATPSLDKGPEPPGTSPESPQRADTKNLPPTPPPKPKPAPLLPPVPISPSLPRTNVITGISGRSPVNSLFGAKPQPLPIPISPSQIRAQLRPAPPRSPHAPPTLPLPPLRRIPSQPNPQPPPQSQLPPLPSPRMALKHDFIPSSSPDSRSDPSQTLKPTRANQGQGDRDSGLSTVTVTPATITTAKTEVVRTAIASFIDSDSVSLPSQREGTHSTAAPELQTGASELYTGKKSPRSPEPREALDGSIVSETSLLRDGPRSKWPAPPPPPMELGTDSTPRRVSRFRTTSLGRVTQLQAMASPVIAHFSHGSSDTASTSTSESAPLVTPDGVNGVPHASLAKGGLAPETRLLDSISGTFGGVDVETENREGSHASEAASAAMHPLLMRLRPFIAPRNPASCFTNLVEIAEGESGSVFAARVGGFGEQQKGERPMPSGTSHVAIKRIPLPPPSSSTTLSDDSPLSNKLSSVLHELMLLKDLDHEHLLLPDAVYAGSASKDEDTESASVVDTSLWIRMELMERSLADVIGLVAEGLTLQERLIGRFASDILCGLDYLQRRHIAHRDVRSDNLLVNAIGVVKLADFSNAICVDRNAPMVKGAVGVIYWQAPEMRTGSYDALKVDSWSLGATVWELAETVPPFSMPASPSAQASFAIETTRHVGSQWPPLTHPEHYSRAFHEFLRLCGRESVTRPGAGELLNTPFIRNACGRAVILQLLSQCRAIEEAMMAKEAGG